MQITEHIIIAILILISVLVQKRFNVKISAIALLLLFICYKCSFILTLAAIILYFILLAIMYSIQNTIPLKTQSTICKYSIVNLCYAVYLFLLQAHKSTLQISALQENIKFFAVNSDLLIGLGGISIILIIAMLINEYSKKESYKNKYYNNKKLFFLQIFNIVLSIALLLTMANTRHNLNYFHCIPYLGFAFVIIYFHPLIYLSIFRKETLKKLIRRTIKYKKHELQVTSTKLNLMIVILAIFTYLFIFKNYF